MVLEGILGALVGGAARLAPDVIAFFDKKNEREHELAMLDRNIELDRMKSKASVDVANINAASGVEIAQLAAMAEGIKAQGQLTGNKKIDAFNALIRPLVAFWWVVVLYTAVLAARFYLLLESNTPTAQALVSLWGDNEAALVSSIVMFFFVGRTSDHIRRGK